jgi:hypothetical protein
MTSDSRHYIVSPHALIKARTFGMYGAAEDRIRHMANQSWPFAHPVGNRRFHQFLLKIEGEVVVDLIKFTPEEIARYDSPSYREPIAESAAPSAETEKAKIAEIIGGSRPTPQPMSYAQQWALQNKKNESKQ